MEFESMLTPREKSPLPKMSPEEDRTRDTVDSELKHYQLSYSGPRGGNNTATVAADNKGPGDVPPAVTGHGKLTPCSVLSAVRLENRGQRGSVRHCCWGFPVPATCSVSDTAVGGFLCQQRAACQALLLGVSCASNVQCVRHCCWGFPVPATCSVSDTAVGGFLCQQRAVCQTLLLGVECPSNVQSVRRCWGSCASNVQCVRHCCWGFPVPATCRVSDAAVGGFLCQQRAECQTLLLGVSCASNVQCVRHCCWGFPVPATCSVSDTAVGGFLCQQRAVCQTLLLGVECPSNVQSVRRCWGSCASNVQCVRHCY